MKPNLFYEDETAVAELAEALAAFICGLPLVFLEILYHERATKTRLIQTTFIPPSFPARS